MSCNTNRLYVETGQTITRGTSAPIVMDLPFDLTGWTVTFTLRTSIADLGTPVVQCDNTDLVRMQISGNRCTVTLSDTDTWAIPEKAAKVFIQLNLRKLVDVNATLVYALTVGPNIMEVTPSR